MYYYLIYGLRIQSDYEFEEAFEIPRLSDTEVDVVIKQETLSDFITKETKEDDVYESGLVYANRENEGWGRKKGVGAFYARDGKEVLCQTKEGYDYLLFNQMLLCAALPTILRQRKDLAFHGSGLIYKGKMIIISGESGAGKSTLASRVLKQGAVFMADDTVAVQMKDGKILAQSAYPQQKICVDNEIDKEKYKSVVVLPPDAGEVKYAARLKDGFTMEEQELYAIFILKADDVSDLEISEIQGSEKIKYITDNIYQKKRYLDMGMPVDVFKKYLEVGQKVKVYSVVRPKIGMWSDIICQKIGEILEGGENKNWEK